MKFLKALLIIVIILIIIVGILTMVAPTHFTVTRSAVINAPREVVYKNISTFTNLHKWGPWDRKDTTMKTSIEGTDGTVGAKWMWEGNKEVGQGEQTFTKLEPGKEVDMHLHFIKPMSGHAETMLMVGDTTGGTKVDWQFNSSMGRPFNIIGLFVDMDKAIGKDFEQGLANLKELSESEHATTSTGVYQINEVDMPAKVFVGDRETVSISDIGKFLGEKFPKIDKALQKANIAMAGPPSAIYYTYDTVTMHTDMAAAFPVKEVKKAPDGWEVINVPPGKALMIDYFGSYAKVGSAYNQLGMYAAGKSMKMKWAMEEYVTDPMMEKDTAKWETKIYYYAE